MKSRTFPSHSPEHNTNISDMYRKIRYGESWGLILSIMILAACLMQTAIAETVPDSLFQMIGYATTGEGTNGGEGGSIDTIAHFVIDFTDINRRHLALFNQTGVFTGCFLEIVSVFKIII